MEVIIRDRVVCGVFVEAEQGDESNQQQPDPVAGLAPDDQPPESGDQDHEERLAVERLAGRDADRHGQADQG